VLSFTGAARGTFKGKDGLAIDAAQKIPHIVQDLEEIIQFFGLHESNTHNMPFGHDHGVAFEESPSSGYNVKMFGLIQDVLLMFRIPLLDLAEQALVRRLGAHAFGILRRMIAEVYFPLIENLRHILNHVINAQHRAYRIDYRITPGEANVNRIEDRPAGIHRLGEVNAVFVVVEDTFHHSGCQVVYYLAGMETCNGGINLRSDTPVT
jgi:hypothetical protein